MQQNSNRCQNVKKNTCTTFKFQSYDLPTLGKVITYKAPISCSLQKNCSMNQYKFDQYVLGQQNLYAVMRRFPERFPLIPWVQNMNLTPSEQRAYSNIYYRQLGVSNSLPANGNFGGFRCIGSDVPYSN